MPSLTAQIVLLEAPQFLAIRRFKVSKYQILDENDLMFSRLCARKLYLHTLLQFVGHMTRAVSFRF